MSSTPRTFFVYINGERKAFNSETAAVLFKKIGFASNGVDEGIEISSDGTGFDFAGKAISNASLSGSLLVNASVTVAKLDMTPLAANLAGNNLSANTGVLSVNTISLATSLAGTGITATAGVLSVNTSGITSSLAGLGLVENAGAMDVNVDNSTLEINSDTVRVKNSGIGSSQIANSSITASHIGTEAVTAIKIATAAIGEGLQGGNGTAVALDYTEAVTMEGDVTANDFVYILADGTASVVQATTADLNLFRVGIALETKTDGQTCKVLLRGTNYIVGGFTGLTANAPVFVSKTTAGGWMQSLSTLVATDHAVRVGFATDTTHVRYDFSYLYQQI